MLIDWAYRTTPEGIWQPFRTLPNQVPPDLAGLQVCRPFSMTFIRAQLILGCVNRKAEASFWTAEEMDLSKDMHDWENKLNDNERVSLPSL